MEKDDAIELVKKELPEKRFNHTIGVMETSVKLAEKYHGDVEKAELAAILHDIAKYWSRETMTTIIKESDISDELLNYHLSLWHAHVGADYMNKHGVHDEEIIWAIRYHTTGRKGMTLLEKIVFLADYIEPGRRFPGVEDVRELAEKNLDAAVVQALMNTMTLLIDRKQQIHPDTVDAYNDLVKKEEV